MNKLLFITIFIGLTPSLGVMDLNSKEGAAFVNTKHNYMKSAFKSDEYDEDVEAMMEVLKKWKVI